MLHPQFDAFLRHALGNSKPLNDFLRRAAFERLPGSTESKVFLNLDDEGVGNTGKTTLLHCMRIVWGDYAVMVDADLFLASRHGTMSSNQESEWALTEGTRLVVSDEISAGREIASARIKRITSGMVAGEVNIRQKYEKTRTGRLSATFWPDGNDTAHARTGASRRPVSRSCRHPNGNRGAWRRCGSPIRTGYASFSSRSQRNTHYDATTGEPPPLAHCAAKVTARRQFRTLLGTHDL